MGRAVYGATAAIPDGLGLGLMPRLAVSRCFGDVVVAILPSTAGLVLGSGDKAGAPHPGGGFTTPLTGDAFGGDFCADGGGDDAVGLPHPGGGLITPTEVVTAVFPGTATLAATVLTAAGLSAAVVALGAGDCCLRVGGLVSS